MRKENKISEPENIKQLLKNTFSEKRVRDILNYYYKSIKKFQSSDWENCILNAGKFIEAALKALFLFCGQNLPKQRDFNVGKIVEKLKNLDANKYDDIIRLLIPRACVFVYDIASNRGARHDPTEIDSNKMDSIVVIQNISWILAEMIRFSQRGKVPPDEAITLVETLMEKKYPDFEEIDNRVYVNYKKFKSANECALLILYKIFPKRIAKNEFVDCLKRHGFKQTAIKFERLSNYIDIDKNDSILLRVTGRRKAEEILNNK